MITECPPTIPREVWKSHEEAMAQPPDKFPRAWAAHLKLLRSYVQDEHYHFLKDESGNWLRKEVESDAN